MIKEDETLSEIETVSLQEYKKELLEIVMRNENDFVKDCLRKKVKVEP